jgi:hypothetical protein
MTKNKYPKNVERGAYHNMMHRCHNPEHKAYYNYGARGIEVCSEWRDPLTGFSAFVDYIGKKPSPELTLDRLDNDLGYQPGNVAWRTRKEQQNNRRIKAGPVTLDGRTQTLAEWSAETSMTTHAISARIRRGLSDAEILCPTYLPRGSGRSKAKVSR